MDRGTGFLRGGLFCKLQRMDLDLNEKPKGMDAPNLDVFFFVVVVPCLLRNLVFCWQRVDKNRIIGLLTCLANVGIVELIGGITWLVDCLCK